MEYFRFRTPKYALIAANSGYEAIQLYKEKNGYGHTKIYSIVEQIPLDHLDSDERKILMLHLLSQNPKADKELLEQANSKEQMLIDALSYEEYIQPVHSDETYDF